MPDPDFSQPFDKACPSSGSRRRDVLARLVEAIRAQGGTEADIGVAIQATTDRFALGDLWWDLCGGAP
jgi:hypothetical protein